ncbi:MAG: ABC transporter substrate-binding protein [Acidimicrobiia bacterium]|nr:ABC transporter substrate-binding protein [Acidimicrobiia bacterium]MYC57596.1 ABC transporter substrate-binding protein [Acidimicrobiia bacterium]MYG94886.1 ABC transporter substrate-binding protein [Acidimicrobiia bacterium]MYI31273.1 ABC transporter substrate-binding protein [Acidimicrobiia bacterium]
MLKSWRILLAVVTLLALLVTSCSNDADDEAGPALVQPTAEAMAETTPMSDATDMPEASSVNDDADPTVIELGGGATINLSECPEEWDNYAGVTETEIRVGSSLPRSGALAGFGTVADGLSLYFEDVGLIDGRKVVMISRDDGYVPARTVTNVEEMIDVENLLGFAGILGSPNNLAVRDVLNENCIPQLFNLTGLPDWGDPNNYPWTTGGLMSYDTEARAWCQHIADEIGEGATAAVLALGNDAGEAWRVAFNDCAVEHGIEVVDEVSHDPQAESVGSNVITLAASDADVFIVASSGAFCPQAVATAASLEWDPLVLVSNGCQSIALFWSPVGPAANGIRMINTQKDVSDASLVDDEWVQFVRGSLQDKGVDPEAASHALGYVFAEMLHQVLLDASKLDGGINRINVMRAMWQLDFMARGAIGNSLRRMNGAYDSYLVEAGRMEELVVTQEGAYYMPVSDVIVLEGTTGTFGG